MPHTPTHQPADSAAAARVEALLSQMTVAEKVGQLTQLGALLAFGGPKPEEVIRAGGAGSVLWLNDRAQFNVLQRIAVEESRMKIPLIYGLDVIHGYRTIFPVPLGMAAAWDPQVVEDAQTVAAREARAAGIHWTFAPMLDITRDARWGRIVEGAGEDPYLGAAVARAQVRGFQGEQLSDDPERMVACAKHFAGYGYGDGGRDYDPVYVSEAQLRNTIFPPFQAAVDAGVGSFMSAYMDLNNVPASGNRWLLNDVLRGDMGFEGFVVSDAMAVGNLITQGFARDGADAARRALHAGLDMDMASNTYAMNLTQLVENGSVPMAELDEAARRILTIKVKMGLFENPYVDEALYEQVSTRPEHRQVARRAALASLVLLRNENGALPLPKTLDNVAVIGPLADSMEDTEGSWMVFNHTPAAVTVLEGIRVKLPNAKVTYAPGPAIYRDTPSFFDNFIPPERRKPHQTAEEAEAAYQAALETARAAGTVILVLGESANMSGEAASRSEIDLPGRQQELLEAVVAMGKPVVLVLINGRPLSITWAAEHVPAILEAWQPGTEGGSAVADVLFGDANPGGKLPATFPRKASHAPLYYARTITHSPEDSPRYNVRYWDGAPTPLYPFGYGLSYTTFAIDNLALSHSEMPVGASLSVSADVTNTGAVAGDEVVQLYIHQRYGSDSRPLRELKGFQRVTLQPGEKQTVTFALGPDELRYWSTNTQGWLQEPAEFDVWVGADSRAELHGAFTVSA